MNIDLEELKRLYIKEGKSIQEIANYYNKTYSQIHNIMAYNKINKKEDPRRIRLNKDILYQLYVLEKRSKPETMKILGCCKQTLDKNLKYYNILTHYDDYNEETLISMYINDIKSLTQIYKETKIPKSRIRQILIKNNIKLRDKSSCQCINLNNKENFKKFDFSILKSQSALKRKSQSFFKNHISRNLKLERGNKCEMCGSTENLHVHHIIPQSIILSNIIKENPNKSESELYSIIINDLRYLDKTNMIVVCANCHYTIYHPYIKYHVNQQPNLNKKGGSTTISKESTSQANGDGSAKHPNKDDDIV